MRGSPLELMDSVRTWRTMNGGLKRITHYDIMNDMAHDGYIIDDATVQLVSYRSAPSISLEDL